VATAFLIATLVVVVTPAIGVMYTPAAGLSARLAPAER
jgi:hypothetical protein